MYRFLKSFNKSVILRRHHKGVASLSRRIYGHGFFARAFCRPLGSLAMTGAALLAMFFLLSSSFLYAQELSALPAAGPVTGADEEAPIPSDRLYLDFKGASLLNVLTILSELSGINFVAGKEVAAREVNMVLDDVTLDDALEAISKGSNITYDYIPNRNIYLFRAAADPETSPLLVTRVFKLYYIRASQLREISGGAGSGNTSSGGSSTGASSGALTETTGEATSPILTIVGDILSERGKVNVDDRSNSLVITDTEDRMRMIEEAIVQLDRPLQQVLIEVFLVETFEDLDKFLGIDWTNSGEGNIGIITGGSSPTRFPFNTNLPFFDKNPLKQIVDKTDLGGAAPGAATLGTKSFTSLVVTFKALQTANKVRVLARPKILVLDNSPAIIKITTNAAVGSNSVTTATGQLTSNQQTTTERAEVGTSLRLTPLINTDNRITLTLEPSFATLAAASFGPTANVTVGDVTTRTARTTLMLNDGQTIVLGGLLQSSQNRNKKKVPVIGDIPFFGEAFTRRNQGMEDRELMLFVSPHIVRDPSEVQAPVIPDERDRFDDEFAPFWRVKRKNWFKKIMMEPKPESSKIEGQVIAARERTMADTLEIVASQVEEEPV